MISELFVIKLHNQNLIDKANNFVNKGFIVKQGNYYFLKIDDNFIHELYPLLPQDEKIEKPDYFTSQDPIGAHITVAYEEEKVTLEASDVGQSHHFTIKELCSVILGNKEYFVLIVNSFSMDALRCKYNLLLKPKFKNVRIDFHITIGVRFRAQ